MQKVAVSSIQKKYVSNAMIYTILVIATILCIFPVIWMIAISIKPINESVQGFDAIKLSNPTFENFVAIYELLPILKQTFNSLFTTLIGAATTVFFCALAGFAFAKFSFPGRNILFYSVIAIMLVPLEVGVIPMFSIMRELNLINSLWSLIIPQAATAIGIFFMKQYIEEVPNEVLQAAKIDGCNDFQTFWRIVLPVIKPGLAAWGTLAIISRWNDFFWPLIFLRTPDKFTLMVSISLLPISEGLSTPWAVIMAGTVIAVVPVVTLYFILEKFQVSGLTDGAVKG